MKIASAEFKTAAVDERGWPGDGLPQVAFIGRSNVGKSSVINSLLGRRGLVKTSGTPGKTREINFFIINGDFYFVDLPGFGYARVPGKIHSGWGPMIESYLKGCKALRLVVFLLDIRHEPGGHDLFMNEWLRDNRVPSAFVATKSDKVSRGNRQRHVKAISDALGVGPDEIIQYSAATGEGKSRLWEAIRSSIK